MSTETTNAIETARGFARTIAELVNAHHSVAPYAELAQSLIDMQELGQHGKVHTVLIDLQRAVLTSTGWNTAKISIGDALKRRGYQFTSSVDYRMREKPTKTFKIAKIDAVKADKKAQAERDQIEADQIEADGIAERARLQAERDASMSPSDLVNGLLAECKRLGLSPLDCLTLLTNKLNAEHESAGFAPAVTTRKPAKRKPESA